MNKFFLLIFMLPVMVCAQTNTRVDAIIKIDTTQGHSIEEGCSGFNVRIADKVWSYSHPDFRASVHGLKPGWLRYFSGTMGDAFNSATGLYDKDYAMMFDHQKSYFKAYEFTQVKGPHRIIDLYHLLGEVGGKLVVTINGFSETPEVAGQLALFCKNNNIQVEAWQFCNEPYFYVPNRERYWWNDGYDYAAKMKPYAEAILEVLPDAKLALNCSWDGIWGFMKEIHSYQEENGAYWNVFSKHSYAPHVGGRESFEKGYKRANTKIIEATDTAAMQSIEDYTWEGVPMLITEFGVWNSPLNGIYSAIYNAEYTLRQLQHPNLFYIASHEISNKYKPAKNRNSELLQAYKDGVKIDSDTLLTGIVKDDEGKAIELIHEATNNSKYTWDTEITGGTKIKGLKGTEVEGMYARAFKGISGYDYLIVTNKSDVYHDCKVQFADAPLSGNVSRRYIWSAIAQNKDVEMFQDEVAVDPLSIPPFSVVLIKWRSQKPYAPTKPRIYQASIQEDGVSLRWWKRDIATGYKVVYGTDEAHLNKTLKIKGSHIDSALIKGLKNGEDYYFSVLAYNKIGESELSSTVKIKYQKPLAPLIFKTAKRDTTITVMWQSVPYANGYKVNVQQNGKTKHYDANNVFGYRIEGLQYDKPYSISVSAYNGLGEGLASGNVVVTCKEHLPLPPRNISAKEIKGGAIHLEWITQDTINPDVKYRIYRGDKLHEFSALVDGLSENNYTDKSVKPGDKYFYTVKAYNNDGECSFYPNIASIIKMDNQLSLKVSDIQIKESEVYIKVEFSNVNLDGDFRYGVAINDVSYLTEEETQFISTDVSSNYFLVVIPKSEFKLGRKYAIKAYINTNGESIYSLPPHKNLKLNQ